jgi:predicted nucleotidyltransferase
MEPTAQDRAIREQELARLTEQSKNIGARKITLFGSLARGERSLQRLC